MIELALNVTLTENITEMLNFCFQEIKSGARLHLYFPVGAPVVNRYNQIKHLFLESDTPNLNDHEFVVPDYLLNKSDCMFLENASDASTQSQDETLAYRFQNVNNIILTISI